MTPVIQWSSLTSIKGVNYYSIKGITLIKSVKSTDKIRLMIKIVWKGTFALVEKQNAYLQ